MSGDPVYIHGTAVSFKKSGILIIGKPGSGKSSLALELIGLGATLVADDQVLLVRTLVDEPSLMQPPKVLEGMIEARGVGLLRAPWTPARLRLVIDLDKTEAKRFPERHETVIADQSIRCLYKVESPAFASMIMAYVKGGRLK